MYFSFKVGRGLPKINVAGGALVSFNLRSSFLGRPQGQRFFFNSGAKAKARALIKRLKAGIGAEGKGQGQVPPPLSPCRASGAILTVYTLHHLSFPLPRQRRDFLNLNLSNFRSQRIGLGPGRVRFRVGGKRFRVGGIGSGSAGQAKAKAKLRALNKRLRATIGAASKGEGQAKGFNWKP